MALKQSKPPLTETILGIMSEAGDVVDAYLSLASFKAQRTADLRAYYRRKSEEKAEEKREAKRVRRAVKALESAKYVTGKGKLQNFKLTKKGWLKLALTASRFYEGKGKDKRKAYMVIFDIPDSYVSSRNLLRRCLTNLGFDHEQKSVFITRDKKAFDFILKVTAESGLKRYIKFAVVEKFI
jgi:DNA-binding transcriptional regulator PaaX